MSLQQIKTILTKEKPHDRQQSFAANKELRQKNFENKYRNKVKIERCPQEKKQKSQHKQPSEKRYDIEFANLAWEKTASVPPLFSIHFLQY